MYPIERFLGTLKRYVTNRAWPEGSIAEAYIAKESVNFIKREHNLAHWFVLYNTPEVIPFLEEHKRQVHVLGGRNITNIQREEFFGWFKNHMNQLRSQGSRYATDELWAVANDPNCLVHQYSGCMVNAVRFLTRDRDNRHKSQNSGLVVEGEHDGQIIDFFGYVSIIYELTYINGSKVVLFKCEWYNTGRKDRIHIDAHVTTVDVRGRWYEEDPFALPNQIILDDDEPTVSRDEPIADNGDNEDDTLAEYLNEDETDQSEADIDSDMEYDMPSRSEEELSSSGEDDLEDEFANMAGQGRQRHHSAVSQLQRTASQSTVPERAANPDLSSPPSVDSSVGGGLSGGEEDEGRQFTWQRRKSMTSAIGRPTRP
ncbi:hypothetical protein AAC387_Pa11g0760 [Persea americana]